MGTRVALVHDYLNQNGGAEKVLEVLHDQYPDAPVYTSIYAPELMPADYRTWHIHTSFMQHLPFIHRHHQPYLMLYPSAFERFRLDDYDLVLSSSSAFAKSVHVPHDVPHICYCHSPMRFVWDFERYAERERMNGFARRVLPLFLKQMRQWDLESAQRVDTFIANSTAVAQRIKKYWGRDSEVIYPPVDIDAMQSAAAGEVGDYFLLVSRLVPYKRFDIAIDAFNTLGLPLKIIGSGRAREDLERRAGPTIEFLGFVSEEEKRRLFARCRAAIFPAEDDFGIAQVEVQAAGRPVIALGAGGALDTVVDGVTGILFQPQTPEGVIEAVRRFETIDFSTNEIVRRAKRFSRARFERDIARIVDRSIHERTAQAVRPTTEATVSWN
jgi:glycosyltransferase involved in cell wall biosynthesis